MIRNQKPLPGPFSIIYRLPAHATAATDHLLAGGTRDTGIPGFRHKQTELNTHQPTNQIWAPGHRYSIAVMAQVVSAGLRGPVTLSASCCLTKRPCFTQHMTFCVGYKCGWPEGRPLVCFSDTSFPRPFGCSSAFCPAKALSRDKLFSLQSERILKIQHPLATLTPYQHLELAKACKQSCNNPHPSHCTDEDAQQRQTISNFSTLYLENTAATVTTVISPLLFCHPSLSKHKHSLCPRGPQMFPIVQLPQVPEWLTLHFQEWAWKNLRKQSSMVK